MIPVIYMIDFDYYSFQNHGNHKNKDSDIYSYLNAFTGLVREALKE